MAEPELTVACVLRSGGLYTPAWVERLRRNVARFAPPHRFVCLSDVEVGCERVPLKHGWPGWWSILEVFRPGLFTGRVVYFDLANLVVDRIEPFFAGSGFRIAPAPVRPPPKHGMLASGAMAFDAGDSDIYERFVPVAAATMRRLHGDQEWIEVLRPDAATFPPELAVSFRGACLPLGGLPAGAAVVFCHGRPKPHEIDAPWFRALWDADG